MIEVGIWRYTHVCRGDMLIMGFSPEYIDDMSIYDSVCIYECLPMWTKTMRDKMDSPYGIDSVLMANTADTVRALATGLGGSKMKDNDFLAPQLTGTGEKKAKNKKKNQDSLINGLKRTHK